MVEPRLFIMASVIHGGRIISGSARTRFGSIVWVMCDDRDDRDTKCCSLITTALYFPTVII